MILTDLPYRSLAIVRGSDRDAALQTVLTLAGEGITASEVTLTTDDALWVIEQARRELGHEALIGAGPVLSVDDAARAADAALAAGAVAVGAGSPLIGDGGDQAALRARAAQWRTALTRAVTA
ncbi:hypothetical protein OHA84_35325 [Streptomyces sp. NBC_00513]|uniref:hypothetical protein n=1 Tax=unclassified Streptomyces TaxID=2593676 RepID=UPI00224E05F6|nr:hypothetical protein [Streptomyces sp. NBC_00424]MCX5071211.1 hypothetical protein [Streptomyces sp. NBC_00424]WUD45372.1 hypothetical protein OHA84_35325 [Streptomyces sp. NBC_00513]